MVKQVGVLLLLCLSLTLLVGCWDYQDLDELSIPVVGLYDLAETDKNTENTAKNDGYNVAAIIPVLYPETKQKYAIDYQKGQTIGDTREKRVAYTPEKYILGMVQVGIYGERLARTGLYAAMESLVRIPKVKSTIYMAVMDGETEELSKLELKGYPNPGIYLLGLLRHAQMRGFLVTTNLHQFTVQEDTTGKHPVVPLLKMKNNRIEISGTGIFKKDKLIAKIDLKDTRALVLLRGLEGEGYLPFVVQKAGEIIDEGTVLVKHSRKVRVIREGDNFTFQVTVNVTGNLQEHSSQKLFVGTKNTMELAEIEQAIKGELERDCRQFISKMQQELKVDCVDITKYALAKWRRS